MGAFVERFEYPGSVEEFRDHVLYDVVARNLANDNWGLTRRDDSEAAFERWDRSTWVYVACVLLFPIGLLALLTGKSRRFLTFRWTGHGDRTEVVVTGHAPQPTVRQIRRIDGTRLRAQLAERRPAQHAA